MEEAHLGNGNKCQHLPESEIVSIVRKQNMKPQNSLHEEEEQQSNTTNTHSSCVDKEEATLHNQTEQSNIEQTLNNFNALQNVMECVESEHQVQREERYDFNEPMPNNETEIVDELEVYHAQMEKSMHLSSPLRHLMKEHNFNVVDYSDKTSTSVASSESSSSESQLSHSSAPTSESYSYTSSSIASATSSETEMSTNTTSTLIYETHASSPSTMLRPENEKVAHHHKHNLQNNNENDTISFTLSDNINNINNNTAYALLPELMNDMDGELLEIIRSYYARKQQQQQQQQQQEQLNSHNNNNSNNEKLTLEKQERKPNKYHHSHHENQDEHNAKGKMQAETRADKISIHKNSLNRRESSTVQSLEQQAPNNISKEYVNCTEQVKLPEPPTLNVMDGNYIGDDDPDGDNKLITDLRKAKNENRTHNTSTTSNNNKGRFEYNGVLRNRHRHNTNNHNNGNNNINITTQNTNRPNRRGSNATQEIAHNYHHQHHLSYQNSNKNHYNNNNNNNNHHNYYRTERQRDESEEEEELELSSSEEEGELLHQQHRSTVQWRSFADDFRLPEYSSTSFVRAYFADIHLNAEPAVLVSGLAAALNMAIVFFLQHHVLDTQDHLGLFLIGSYLVFATYYMTYYFLERFSSSFRTITSLDKKFYVISNLLKAGIFVSITPFAFYHLIQMIVFDKWENNILRNLGCIYTVPDFIAIIIVKRMRWSTWIHHWCVVAFNYFSIMNDYRNENVCRCVVVYAAFSSFAYCVNVLLASRFLGLPTLTSHILAYVALMVYALCCAVNWVWQAYYLHRLMTTGHRHWTVYAYMVLISLVMWDDVVLTKWLYNNAQSSAFVMAARQEQQKQQESEQQQQREEQHRREELEEEKQLENYFH